MFIPIELGYFLILCNRPSLVFYRNRYLYDVLFYVTRNEAQIISKLNVT